MALSMLNRDDILATVSKMIQLLRAAGEDSWAIHLEDAAARLMRPESTSRAAGLELLAECYGGMGSLNDLVFSLHASNVPDGYTEERANHEFRALKRQLYDQIQSAKRRQ